MQTHPGNRRRQRRQADAAGRVDAPRQWYRRSSARPKQAGMISRSYCCASGSSAACRAGHIFSSSRTRAILAARNSVGLSRSTSSSGNSGFHRRGGNSVLTERGGGEMRLKISKAADPHQTGALRRQGRDRHLRGRQPCRAQRPQRRYPPVRPARIAPASPRRRRQQGFGLCRVFEHRLGAETGIRVFRKLFSELLQTLCDVGDVIAVGQRRAGLTTRRKNAARSARG